MSKLGLEALLDELQKTEGKWLQSVSMMHSINSHGNFNVADPTDSLNAFFATH